ncbi:hypothetical protein FQN49_005181 [Arthroderma sp. PD_2]|nr:hypothetical protein FQN49_005181 [Arthroderma sp. PD_2]
MTAAPSETTGLLPREETTKHASGDDIPVNKGLPWRTVFGIIGALIGVFLAGADESMVLVTYQNIASHFQRLGDSPWVLVGYNLGYCVALPVHGKLSDTYGRRRPLIVSYCLFSGGCVLSGAATTLWQVIAGRVITGVGAAGMVALVSVLVTDSVLPSQVAIVRGYVNTVGIFGRILGGPIGAFVTDGVGWKLSFILQAPTALICCIISMALLPVDKPRDDNMTNTAPRKKVDFLGISMFAISITSFLIVIRLLGNHNASAGITILFGVLSLLFGGFFFLVEGFYAKEPVIPLDLLRKMAGPYALQVLVHIGVFANITNVAPYFIRTTGASNTKAAFYLLPVFVGFTIGSIACGYVIKTTHRYKTMSLISILLALISFALIAIRWRYDIGFWESLYEFPVSLSFGLLLSTTFTGLIACTPKSIHATAICVYYLCQQVGTMVGTVSSSFIIETVLHEVLKIRLEDIPNKKEIIERILQDASPGAVPDALRAIVRSSYLYSFQFAAFLPMVTTAIALPILIMDKEVEVE